VRWTAQRNFEAVLDMMAERRLRVAPLISHTVPFAEAHRAYDLLRTEPSVLGLLLQYGTEAERPTRDLTDRVVRLAPRATPVANRPVVAFIGAGNYANQVLIPAFRKSNVYLKTIVSSGGVSAVHAGRKHGFEEAGSDHAAMLSDPAIDAIAITTRHDTHVRFICDALRARKHVFVEKPLALDRAGLDAIKTAYHEASISDARPLLMVGFNRRFAPQVVKIKKLLDAVTEPKTLIMTVNAGAIPADHWTQKKDIGGGRIVGEACHFIDLLRFLCGAEIVDIQAQMIGPTSPIRDDKITFTLAFSDGSFGTVHYLASGHKSFPKERLEVFCAGSILQLDNFRRLTGYGWPGFRSMNLWTQDKGNAACVSAFVDAIVHGHASPIPFDELIEVTEATFDVDARVCERNARSCS
jgi:predicted dehydrogenase